MSIFHFSQCALRHWPSGLRTVSHEQIRVTALTFLNFKNGWNTYMCSSSTLAITPNTSVNYSLKKWNTPVPLLSPNQSTFPRNNPNF